MDTTSICIAHFSDIHIAAAKGEVNETRRYLGKRLLGTVNLRFLGRGDDFSEARERFRSLLQDIRQHKPDLIISSGDFSAMSFPEEFTVAKEILQEELADLLPRFAFVPGNHDRYTLGEIWTNHFHRTFGLWLHSDFRPAGMESLFPYVRIVKEKMAFLFVDCARFNFMARGKVKSTVLEDLEGFLASPELQRLTSCLVLHYPPIEADGSALSYGRRCVNMNRLLELAEKYSIPALLTGHIHHNYLRRVGEAGPYVLNAGSGTHRKHSTYNLYYFQGRELLVEHRHFQTERKCFECYHQEKLSLMVS